jgi:hypothetical protein
MQPQLRNVDTVHQDPASAQLRLAEEGDQDAGLASTRSPSNADLQ